MYINISIYSTIFPNLQIRFLPCVPDKADKSGLSAYGVYVNFLETSRAVFVPQYRLAQDKEIIDIIKTVTEKPIVALDCTDIARYGGAIHCLTKEYKTSYDAE